jgi:hypothetical protein
LTAPRCPGCSPTARLKAQLAQARMVVRAPLVREPNSNPVTGEGPQFLDKAVVQLPEGRISPEEADSHPERHLLYRALGRRDSEPEYSVRETRSGDRYLLRRLATLWVMTSVPATGVMLVHLGLALVALAVVGSLRWWVRRGANRDTPARLLELAYLNGGHRLVVYTALAALRRCRMVQAGSRGIIAVPGAALPEGGSALYAAVLSAARGPRSIEDLLRDSTVAARRRQSVPDWYAGVGSCRPGGRRGCAGAACLAGLSPCRAWWCSGSPCRTCPSRVGRRRH